MSGLQAGASTFTSLKQPSNCKQNFKRASENYLLSRLQFTYLQVLVSKINPSSCSSQSVSGSTWAQKEFQQQSKPHAHTSRQRRCGFLGVLNKIFYRLLHLDIFSNLPETQVVWEKDLTPWVAMVLVRFRGILSVCMVLKYHHIINI